MFCCLHALDGGQVDRNSDWEGQLGLVFAGRSDSHETSSSAANVVLSYNLKQPAFVALRCTSAIQQHTCAQTEVEQHEANNLQR
jgi:hypothetical protein